MFKRTRSVFLFLAVITLSRNVIAQDTTGKIFSGNWHIKNMISIDDSTALGHFENAQLSGLIAIDHKGRKLWELPVNGYIKGEGKWKENVIIFYSNDARRVGELHAAVVDIKAKKIVQDKIVLNVPKKEVLDLMVQNDPAGNFDHLLLRTLSRKSWFLLTSHVSLMYISPVLETSVFTLWGEPDRKYIGSYTSAQGNVFISGITDNMLITEKFGPDGTLLQKLQVSLDVRDMETITGVMRPDTFSVDNMLVGIQYKNKSKDRIINLYSFDFNAEKIVSAPPVTLDKAYHRSLVEKEPKAKAAVRWYEDMVPVDILSTPTKVILVKEIRKVNDPYSAMSFVNNDAVVVSMYSRQLQPIQETILNKLYANGSPWTSELKCFIHNEKLYVLATSTAVLNSYSDYFFIVYLNNGNKERKIFANAPGMIDPPATVLFKEGCTIGYVIKLGPWGKQWKSHVQYMRYEDFDKLANDNR